MNPLPPNADELVSAYLDGEAAPDEIAIVESSAELMARVESLRTLTGQLGATITPPPEQKETHLAAALGAFDELFADSAGETTDSPSLVAVPDPPASPATQPTPESPPVQSLDAARDRRDRRRFTPAVIAAAVAAVLMVVVVAALSLGGGTADDLATSTAADSAESADFAADASDDTAAMTETDAASLDQEAGGLSEVETQRVSPAPTVNALQAPSAAEAVDEAAGDDQEEAMEDEAMEEEEAMADDAAAADEEDAAMDDSDAGDVAPTDGDLDLALGSFPTTDAVLAELESLSVGELIDRRNLFGQGLFTGCATEIPELSTDVDSLAGTAFANDDFVEIHLQLDADDVVTLYLVSLNDCTVVGTTTIP